MGYGANPPEAKDVDPSEYNRWYIPRTSPDARATYLFLVIWNGEQRWADKSGRVLKGSDPIEVEQGQPPLSLSDLTNAIFTIDYAAIVREGMKA